MQATRLHWTRGRMDEARTLEWIGCNDAGEAIARVVRILGPMRTFLRSYRAVALDDQARIVQLRTNPPDGADWLACVGGKVVGRSALPLEAVRTAEAAIQKGQGSALDPQGPAGP